MSGNAKATTSRPARVAITCPGQVVKVQPRVESLMTNSGLAVIVRSATAALEEAVGKDLATEALQADNETLVKETLLGQLRSFYTATVMWLSLLHYSPDPSKQSFGDAIANGLVTPLMTGDSVGFDTAAYAPGPGHLDDQLAGMMQGARNTKKRAEFMQETPHSYEIGGMAVVGRLWGWRVRRLVGRVNEQIITSEHRGLLEVVKDNAPKLKIVAGPSEGLKLLEAYVAGKREKGEEKGASFIPVSPYWFHHSIMKAAGIMYGLHLEKEGMFPPPSPLLMHSSGVDGKIVPPDELVSHLSRGVWNPMRFYTFRGPSVHGAMYKNDFCDTIIMNREIGSWLASSRHIATHLMNDLQSLAETHDWLTNLLDGKVKPGKECIIQQSKVVPQQRQSPVQAYQL